MSSRLPRAIAAALLALALTAPLATPAAAQDAAPAADPADVASVDAIIAALYASISGPAGAPRDFDRLRSLLGPDARFIPTGMGQNGRAGLRNLTVDQYIALAGPALTRDGFYEREIGRTQQTFGNVTHLMSAYDSRRTPDGEPFARGVNSIQLFFDGERWFILSIMWDAERPGLTIPEAWLTPGD